jgi:hypothetical protein
MMGRENVLTVVKKTIISRNKKVGRSYLRPFCVFVEGVGTLYLLDIGTDLGLPFVRYLMYVLKGNSGYSVGDGILVDLGLEGELLNARKE